MDLAREFGLLDDLGTAIGGVSILVLVDLARELYFNTPTFLFLQVSILVLVDLARESVTFSGKSNCGKGFNPCFSGSCSRISLSAGQKALPSSCPITAVLRFQSLF